MTATLGLLAAVLAAAGPAPAHSPAAPAPAAVEEVQITAARAPVLGTLQQGVLNYRPEFFTPVRPSTAMDMVNWLPGFTFEDTRDMRGLEGSTGNVLIDGKPPTSKTDTLTSVLRRIPSDQVERVDIIVGGAPGIDMHGRNMIANVVLKADATAQRLFSVWTYADTHGRVTPSALLTTSEKHDGKVIEGSIEVGRIQGSGPTVGYGPWTRIDGTGATEFASDTHFLFGGPYAIASGAYEFPFAAGKLKANALARYYDDRLSEVDQLTPGPGAYSFGDRELYKRGELGLHYERSIGRATFETQLLERLTRLTSADDYRRPPEPSTFTRVSDQQETALRAVFKFKKDDAFNLEAFAEGAFNSEDERNAQTVDGIAQVLPAANVKVTESRFETGLTTSWKPNSRIGLDTTLKLESSDIGATGDVTLDHTLTYWKPRAVVNWSIDKDTQLRLRVEREVAQISFGNFVTFSEYNSGQLRVGNPDLLPQRDWVAEAVFERHFWRGADITLTLRRMAVQDVVDVAPFTTPTGVFGEITNIGDGRETDFIADLTVPLKSFGLDGAMIRGKVTVNRTDVTDPVTGQTRPFSGRSEVQGEFHFAQDFPKLKLNWGADARYFSPSALYRPFGNEASAAWTSVNVFVEYKLQPRLVLRAEVQNLPGGRIRETVDVFTGLRDLSPLNYEDIKRLSVGPLLFLRMRKNF